MVKRTGFMEWIKQRRVWSAALSAVAVVAVVMGVPVIAVMCSTVAGALGLHSYIAPKK